MKGRAPCSCSITNTILADKFSNRIKYMPKNMGNRSLRDFEGWMECTSHKTIGQIRTREASATDLE